MLIAAVGHLYAFPYKEYAGANIGVSRGLTGSLAHAVKLNDFYHDTVHQVNLAICANFLLKTSAFDMNPVLMMMVTVVLLLQFAPTYHDYVLYNHNEGDEGTRKYRSRTFVPTGPEMDAVRKNKHMLGNKLDDIQLSSVSSSGTSSPKQSSTAQDPQNPETMKSSLLMETSNSYNVPYDMSLIDMDLSSYPSKVPAANAGGTR